MGGAASATSGVIAVARSSAGSTTVGAGAAGGCSRHGHGGIELDEDAGVSLDGGGSGQHA